MKFKDYFLGRTLVLSSPLPPGEVQSRIDKAAISSLLPFQFGTVGWSRLRAFRLRQRTSLIDYNAKPMLVGRLVEDRDGTRIEANFGATFWMKAFFVWWYAILVVFFVGAIALGPFQGEDGEAVYFPYLFIPLFAVSPLAMHYALTRGAEYDLEELLAFLEDVANARLVSFSSP